jgi:cell division protein FtsB
MMRSEERQKMLIILLPAALIVAFYVWFVNRGMQTELRSVRTELPSAQQQARAQSDLAAARAELGRLSREKERLEREVTQLEGELTARDCGSQDCRTEGTPTALGDVLARHNVTLLEESPRQPGRPPRWFQSIQAASASQGQTGAPRQPLSEVRLEGDYMSMLGVLRELSAVQAATIVVALNMKRAEEASSGFQWTLTLLPASWLHGAGGHPR